LSLAAYDTNMFNYPNLKHKKILHKKKLLFSQNMPVHVLFPYQKNFTFFFSTAHTYMQVNIKNIQEQSNICFVSMLQNW
jgi:hypothetical protein